jgi:hypothetical protein
VLSKVTKIDRIEVLPETGCIQIRQRISVLETDEEGNSTELSYSYHRYCLEKGSDLTDQPDEVKALAAAAWGL